VTHHNAPSDISNEVEVAASQRQAAILPALRLQQPSKIVELQRGSKGARLEWKKSVLHQTWHTTIVQLFRAG